MAWARSSWLWTLSPSVFLSSADGPLFFSSCTLRAASCGDTSSSSTRATRCHDGDTGQPASSTSYRSGAFCSRTTTMDVRSLQASASERRSVRRSESSTVCRPRPPEHGAGAGAGEPSGARPGARGRRDNTGPSGMDVPRRGCRSRGCRSQGRRGRSRAGSCAADELDAREPRRHESSLETGSPAICTWQRARVRTGEGQQQRGRHPPRPPPPPSRCETGSREAQMHGVAGKGIPSGRDNAPSPSRRHKAPSSSSTTRRSRPWPCLCHGGPVREKCSATRGSTRSDAWSFVYVRGSALQSMQAAG